VSDQGDREGGSFGNGNVFWDGNLLEAAGRSASILAIGDSWFWYFFPGGSLLNQLGPIVAK
jgi:hypothetical protein